MLIYSALRLVGAVTLFLLGLKIVADDMGLLMTDRLKNALYKATANPLSAVGIGAGVTAVAQSGVAINFVLVSLVDGGAVSLLGALAVVIGTNVGTTMTAQITSLSLGLFDVSALGGALAFSGFMYSALVKNKTKHLGGVVMGFGVVFIAIDLLSVGTGAFYEYEWFRSFFLIDNPFVLILNGLFITAVCQSSSVVSSMLVILSSGGLMTFENAVFLILGANVGTTVSVMVFSFGKSVAARRTAVFNVLFNVTGAALFFITSLLTGGAVFDVFTRCSATAGRAVANFHTFFNLAFGVAVLPLIKPLSRLLAVIVRDQADTPYAKTREKRDRNAKKRSFFAR
ncbi:MAG: Na/Pi cotransporter family protein [Clostridia bacterium]|nr:Na/Pi cotransporter family protein [Clostridia bacterium]